MGILYKIGTSSSNYSNKNKSKYISVYKYYTLKRNVTFIIHFDQKTF